MFKTIMNGVQPPLVVIVVGLAIVGVLALVKRHKNKKNKKR